MNKHGTLRNETKNSNSNNTNIQDNNNKVTSTHKGRYRHHNDLTRKKQFIEEKNYDSNIFRHLRSIESRVKKDSDPKNKTIQEQTGTQHQQIRKEPT